MSTPILIRSLFRLIFLLFTFLSFGQQWETLNANSFSWRFEDMYFVSPDKGWVVDGGGQILHTSNGGANWTQQYYNPSMYFRAVEFYDEQIGFAGTLANGNPNAQLLRTTDGGATWVDITSNFPQNIAGICGIHAVDANTVFITGVFYGNAYIMRSFDQGDSWQYFNMGSFANGLVDIYFKDSLTGWAVGQSPQGTGLRAVILGTTNGGNSWNQLAIGQHNNQRSWKLQQLTDNILYASIEEFEPSPQYFKSSNGGQSWNLNNVNTTNTSGTMQGIGFINEMTGWIGGFSQLFYETTDGGMTWEYKPNVGQSYNRFQRVNDTLMYAAGINVYRYADAALSLEEFEIDLPKGHQLELSETILGGGTTEIDLELINNTFCELSLYDNSGRRIQTITSERLIAGNHRIPWRIPNATSGLYHLVLYTYHGYESIKVIIR